MLFQRPGRTTDLTPSLWRQLRPLGRYVRPYRGVLLASFGLSAVTTVMAMAQPYFAKLFIDHVFVGGRTQVLMPLLAGLIVLFILGFGIRAANRYLYTRYSARMLFQMRHDLFRHLQFMDLRHLDRQKSGDLHSRMGTDLADIQALVTDTLPSVIFSALTCIATLVILLHLNLKMALLGLCFTPVALIGIWALRPRLLKLARQTAQKNAEISHFLFESLNHTRLVRSFSGQDRAEGKLARKHDGMLTLLLRHQVLSILAGAIPAAMVIVNTLIVFGYGGHLVLTHQLSIGSLVAISIYQGRLLGPLQGLLESVLTVQKAKVALARVAEIRQTPTTEDPHRHVPVGPVASPTPRAQTGLAFSNVSFAYAQAEPVLKNVSFTIPKGKITALVGPSGSGKSTICHLIMKLYRPDAGRILWDGRDMDRLPSQWVHQRVALVSQDIHLLHASILDNIRFARPEATRAQAEAAARSAMIHKDIESLPNGYNSLVGDNGIRLSGGQKQRISIARALLIAPQILICDEATAFLDRDVEKQVAEVVERLMQDKTMVVVSHRPATVANAHHLIVCDRGEILYEGAAQNRGDGPQSGRDRQRHQFSA